MHLNNQSNSNKNYVDVDETDIEVVVNELDSLPLGMAYVPMQMFRNINSADEALSQGTIFADLNLPFEGK